MRRAETRAKRRRERLPFHESQSRLWENLVARSYDFWVFFYPEFQSRFPEQLAGVSLERFYRAVNKVEPSLIRTEADEATYNLHIMLRHEMEKEMLNGGMEVKDIPEEWNRKSFEYLGIAPQNDSEGVLQDIHWSMGEFGYFPTYALGNLIAAQLWMRAEQELPALGDSIRRGDFGLLLTFLRENLHHHGACFNPEETLRRAVGTPHLDPDCFLTLLEKNTAQSTGSESVRAVPDSSCPDARRIISGEQTDNKRCLLLRRRFPLSCGSG